MKMLMKDDTLYKDLSSGFWLW